MLKYTVILTRDVTESVVVEVLALDSESAETVALEHISNSEEPPAWELDDNPATSDPYVTDVSGSDTNINTGIATFGSL